MEILNITPLNQTRFFKEEELDALLPILLNITSEIKSKENGLKSQINYFSAQKDKAQALSQQLHTHLEKWSHKMRRLGGFPVGTYSVKFFKNNRGNYFLWTYPRDTFEEY